MESFCFEIKTTCKSCGNPIPINAFSEEVFCYNCNNKNTIPDNTWKSIITENIKEAENFKDGEGQNTKMFTGEYEFSFLFGKQKARCSKCKTTIPEEILNSYEKDNYICDKCNNNISVRKPPEFITKISPETKFIIGEDLNQLKTGIEGIKKPGEDKPVLFTCPSCAGNLEIDGTKRMINCKYCDSKIYLPDDLWFELHPVKTAVRWYVVQDIIKKAETFPEWYHLTDTAVDRNGNVYVASNDNDDSEKFLLWSFGPDMKLRWIRKDIKFEYENSGIAVSLNGKLYLWNKFKRSLLVFSCADGSNMTPIKGADVTNENPYPFNLKGCEALLSDSDNTILAIVNNSVVRFYDDGSRAPIWKTVSVKGEKPGFFSRLFSGGTTEVNIPADDDWAPGVKEVGNHPKRINGGSTRMNLGFDNFIYMIENTTECVLIKFNREGEMIWRKEIPLEWTSKPCADANGYVYLLGENEVKNKNLIKISPNGKQIEVLLKDVLEGGILSSDSDITLSSDGTICTFKFYNFLKIFSPDLKCKFETEQSKKEAEERIKEQKKKSEAEE